jgi:hypothetical protein
MSRVTCESLRDALLAGRSPADAELVEHAASCEPCAALVADHASVGGALAKGRAAPGDPLPWSSVEALVKEEVGWRAWLRSRPTPVRWGLACGAFAVVAALGLRHVRHDLDLVPGLELGGLLAVFSFLAYQAFGSALPVTGRPARHPGILAAALGVPVAAAFVRTATTLAPAADSATFLHQAFSCFGYGALLTAPLLAVLWLLDRGAGSRSRVYYAAAAAGLAANAALTLHCPNTSSAHLLVGHATIGLALATVAGLVQARQT